MARPLIVFAHGAGLSSSSEWMQRYAKLMSEFAEVVTFDYEYMRKGRRAPDRLVSLVAQHRAVVEQAKACDASPRPTVLVGKSMGGRVGCHLSLELDVDGLVCLGYPLRGVGPKAKLRDQVLLELRAPILFVQGTRDKLCDLTELESVTARMTASHRLHVVESGDHSLKCTQRHLSQAGLTASDVELGVAAEIHSFVSNLSARA